MVDELCNEDPGSKQAAVCAYRDRSVAQVTEALHAASRDLGYEVLSEESPIAENSPFWISIYEFPGWTITHSYWIPEEIPKRVSGHLGCVASAAIMIRGPWTHQAYDSGRLVDFHASAPEYWSDFSRIGRILGKSGTVMGRGDPGALGRLFGVAPESIVPYLFHLTQPEEASFNLINDGAGHDFIPKIASDDLRTPLEAWAFADLQARLGILGVNIVARTRRVASVDLKFARSLPHLKPPAFDEQADPREIIATLARNHVDSEDPWDRIAAAEALLGTDPSESIRVLEPLLQSPGPEGGQAFRLLSMSCFPEVLGDLLPRAEFLRPLELAAYIRNVRFSGHPGLMEAMGRFRGHSSMLVRLEAVEAAPACGASAHPYERLIVDASRGRREAVDRLADVAPFVEETLPLRSGSVRLRHTVSHLKSRVYAQLFLASLRDHPGVLDRPFSPGICVPKVQDIVNAARQEGIDVTCNEECFHFIWLPEGPPEYRLHHAFEYMIRRTNGGVRVEWDGSRLSVKSEPSP